MKWRYLPNVITALRLLMVGPFLYCTLKQHYFTAFFIFIIASISDGLDGYLARRFQWESKLGAFGDPLADKLLMMSSYVALTYIHQLPLWFTMLVVSRDVYIISGILAWHLLFRTIDFKPTFISKANTVFQLLLIITILYQLSFHYFFINLHWMIQGLIIVTTITTAISFLDYVISWSIKAIQKKK